MHHFREDPVMSSYTVRHLIQEADTPEKVWSLVSALLQDGNNYSDETYLRNAREYTAVAQEMYKD
jgi:hypothetical protein